MLVPALALLTAAQPLTIQQEITTLLADPALKGASISALAVDSTGRVIFDRDSERRMVPASNQKLISSLFALNKLGFSYTPMTLFWREGDTIIINAPGDPTLKWSQLQEVATKLGRAKYVYVQQAYNPGIHGEWEVGDLPNRYAAPVSAFTFDRGSFEVWAENGKIRPMPKEYGLSIGYGSPKGAAKASYNYWTGKLTLSGKLPTVPTMIEAFALRDPSAVASKLFGDIAIGYAVIPKRNPDAAIIGPRLIETVEDCLVRSDNLYAESLLLMGAAPNRNKQVENVYSDATQQAERFLFDTVGWKEPLANVVDGSGLARQNLVTARGLTSLLQWSKTQPWWMMYNDALASPGRGTLEGRLAGSSFRGKTGTLTGVVSLSGFIKNVSGEEIIVSMIVNNAPANSQKVRSILDSVVVKLEQGSLYGTAFDVGTQHGAISARNIPNASVVSPARNWVR